MIVHSIHFPLLSNSLYNNKKTNILFTFLMILYKKIIIECYGENWIIMENELNVLSSGLIIDININLQYHVFFLQF